MKLKLALAFSLALISLAPSVVPAQEDFIVKTTPLPMGRAFHGAAVLGDFLYVFGGSVTKPGDIQEASNSVHVAKIADNGQLSNWIETSSLDLPRHYIANSSIVKNDTAYIIGGSEAVSKGARVNTVAWTRPNPNGFLKPWEISPPFAESGLSTIASFTTSGYLHLTGGLQLNDSVSNQCWSMQVKADGTPGQWSGASPLPAPLWYHCAGVAGGRAYVWGGLNSDTAGQRTPSNKIYSAPVLASGELGPWRTETVTLPVGFYSAASAVAGPYIFSICPRYDKGVASNDIWWTYVTPEGMQPWQRQPTNLPNKTYHAAATDYRRGYIYITGGKPGTGKTPRPEVFFIRLSPDARQAAETQWSSQQAESTQSAQIEYTGDAGTTTLSFEQPAATQIAGMPGFTDLASAQQQSSRASQPLVMYFHVPNSTPCLEQSGALQTPEFASATQSGAFAAIDAGKNPQIAQDHGVFRVPTWIFFNAKGEEKDRAIGVLPAQEISQRVQNVR